MRPNAQYKAAAVMRHNAIVRRKPVAPARRKRLEADPVKWLKWYLAETYTRPFEKPHFEIIRGAINAHETGGRFAVAAERGAGKSAILWGMILYFAMTGKQRYPVCVPWADKALKRAFRFWKNALCFNTRLAADYPEYCQPFEYAKGIAQRVPCVTWRDTSKPTGAQLTLGEGIIVLPDRLGCIGGATINGNIRGLNHPQEDGKVLRPSIALLDDVQDRGTARSAAQIADTIAIIDGDVGGCGDSGRDLPMLLACNCIERGDVADHYLNHSEWKALRIPCIETWPDGWDEPNSAARAAWDEWAEIWRGGGDDLAFYKKNKAVMTTGMVLSAPAAFKGAEKCPDAFYGVIRMFYRMGREAFMAERQQAPVDPIAEAGGPYSLTSEIIQSRTDPTRKMGERPDWVTRVVASTDINPSHALTTVVVGFGEDQSAAVLWYGLHRLSIPGDTPAPELARALFEQLAIHGKALAGLPVVPEVWAIDAGGANFDAVIRFSETSARLCGIPAHGFTGRSAKFYRPYGKHVSGTPREQCHGCLDRKLGRHIRWVAWNSDYWKEVAQRAWLGEIGSPSAISLFDGLHSEFAAQVSNERLLGKGDVGGQTFWNWVRVPGRNDFGDATAQAYALAAYGGTGTGGQAPRRKKLARAVISGRITTDDDTPAQKDAQPRRCRAVIGRRRGW